MSTTETQLRHRGHVADGATMTFRSNLVIQPQVRVVEREGRQFLVAPVVAVVEGVLNQWMVTAQAIEQSTEQWNGTPLVVNHPSDEQGQHVSIEAEGLMGKLAIGTFEQVRYNAERRSLTGEIWVDVERAGAVDGGTQVIERLRAGQPLEVSTGYFAEVEQRRGVFNGKQFGEVHTALFPDHLALLPEAVGACSWRDGCGTPRVNEGGQEMADEATMEDKDLKAAKQDDPTDGQQTIKVNGQKLGQVLTGMVNGQADEEGETESQLVGRMAAAAGCSAGKVKKIMAGEVDFPKRAWLQAFALVLGTDAIDLLMAADADTVKMRRPDYTNAADPKTNKRCGCQGQGDTMNKKEVVNGLIANERTSWEESDREWLEALDEGKLQKLVGNEEQDEEATEGQEEGAPTVNAEEEGAAEGEATENSEDSEEDAEEAAEEAPKANAQARKPAVAAVKKPISAEEYLKQMPTEMSELFGNALQEQRRRRSALLQSLKANAQCQMTEADLQQMSTEQLERMVATVYGNDYAIQGGGGVSSDVLGNEEESDVPAPPRWLTVKENKTKKSA